MPSGLSVTVFPSNTQPRAYNHNALPKASLSAHDIFQQSCPNEFSTHRKASVLFSSNDAVFEEGNVYPTSDSFVRGTIDAWAQHQHLVIRPDEIWFSILVQMNFYMAKNAEKVRHLFVDHEGKQPILVKDYTWQRILSKFSTAIQEKVKTPWLEDWIMPNFSTTTENDVLAANVLVMGLMKAYFEYYGKIICGLPSVTLLGEKADWEALLSKLDHLPDFGEEPKAYARQLQPILSRFVRTFDRPDDPAIREFWKRIVFAESPPNDICGMPPYYFSGWLMGFYFWGVDGEPMYGAGLNGVELDGVSYTAHSIEDLPVAYAQAPFTMLDYPYGRTPKFEAYVLAGNLGKQIRNGLPEGYAEALKRFNGTEVDMDLPHGTLQPLSGWMIYGPAPHEVELSKSTFMDQTLLRVMDDCWNGTCREPRTNWFRQEAVLQDLEQEL